MKKKQEIYVEHSFLMKTCSLRKFSFYKKWMKISYGWQLMFTFQEFYENKNAVDILLNVLKPNKWSHDNNTLNIEREKKAKKEKQANWMRVRNKVRWSKWFINITFVGHYVYICVVRVDERVSARIFASVCVCVWVYDVRWLNLNIIHELSPPSHFSRLWISVWYHKSFICISDDELIALPILNVVFFHLVDIIAKNDWMAFCVCVYACALIILIDGKINAFGKMEFLCFEVVLYSFYQFTRLLAEMNIKRCVDDHL